MTRALVVIGAVLGSSLLLRPAAAEVDSGTLQRSFWGGSVNSGCRTVTIGRAGPLSNNVAAFLDWWGGVARCGHDPDPQLFDAGVQLPHE